MLTAGIANILAAVVAIGCLLCAASLPGPHDRP